MNQLKPGAPLLADGAMGSLLIARGHHPKYGFSLLNLNAPKVIANIHKEYALAGSQILYTNSFQAARHHLQALGQQDQTIAVNQKAVQLARQASPSAWVAGNIGPCHDQSQPLKTLEKNYREQTRILIEAGADMIAIETLTDINQLKLVTEACLSQKTDSIPFSISVTCLPSGHLLDHTPFETWLALLNQPDIDIIGLNCTSGPLATQKPLLKMAKTGKQLSFKPNAGLPQKKGTQWIYPIDSEEFSDQMKQALKVPLSLWGGCCGSDPQYIRKLKPN